MKNIFLHEDLEEDVYIAVPPSFSHRKWCDKVCRLKKTLYGLKQSLRAWFGKFTKSLMRRGYKQSQSNHTLFINHSILRKVSALIVYVDDIATNELRLEK